MPGASLYVETRAPARFSSASRAADRRRHLHRSRGTVGRPVHGRHHDQRGHHGTLDREPEDIPVSVHADDAAILAAVGSEPAYVYGSSGGGTIGLELVARTPIWFARS